MKNSDYIVVGKLASTHGIHGWIKVQTYTTFGADILKFLPWYLQKTPSSPWKAIEIEDHRLQATNLMVKLPGLDTPEQARQLTGALIGITRAQLPALKEDEYYWTDLVGMSVINQHGEMLGKVIYLMETGANDVLVVKGEKEQAIPWRLGSVITHVDRDKQEIHVDWETL